MSEFIALITGWCSAFFFFFFQAEDGIRDRTVTGVQTCALPIFGLFQARHPQVVRLQADIRDLPEELEGYRIVQWSDVHIGPTIQRCFVESLVDQIGRASCRERV